MSADDEWSELADRLMREQLHPNHFLLVRLAERRVRTIRRSLRKGGHSREEERRMLERQAALFAGLKEAMKAADPPGDLWEAAAAKAEAAATKMRMPGEEEEGEG